MRLATPLLFSLCLGGSAVHALALAQQDPDRILPLPPEALSAALAPSMSLSSDPGSPRVHRRASASTASPSGFLSLPSPPLTAPSAPPAPAPTPMDLSISYSLSTPCLSYLSNTLSAPLFRSCLPFSLLLTSSTSYASLVSTAKSTGNYSTLNALLAYVQSPQPSGAQCDTYLAQVFQDIDDKKACGADLKVVPPVAVATEAWAGIGNYQVMREAAGLVDPESGKYCYLEAVASSTPDDLYLWNLQAGISLPGTSRPTCSKCSSLLLSHYSESLNGTNALNATVITEAIQVTNQACGTALVTYSAAPQTSHAHIGLIFPGTWTILLLGLAAMVLVA